MKQLLLSGLVMLGMMSAAQASIYYQGTGVSGDVYLGAVASPTIVDGNPASITANTMTVSGLATSLANLKVTLNISGGMNNGLYGYLVGPNGTTVTLMNQPGYAVDGFGSTGAGMQISLVSSGAANGNVQDVTGSSFLGGPTYPEYNSATSFGSLNGVNPNGAWTLYFSDTIAGGGDATLNGWTLDIQAVPEPTNLALGVFAGLLAVAGLVRRYRLNC